MSFPSPIIFENRFFNQTLRFETGLLAHQAGGNVLVTLGGTTVMATVVVGKNDSSGDYFPLQIVYEEKMYASGKIKGSRFMKREARPSDNAILTGRLIDRSIRSLFNPNLRREIQIIITILSLDEINVPDTLGVLAASLAIQKAGLGHLCKPVSSVKIGLVNPKVNLGMNLIKNFNPENAKKFCLNINLSSSSDKEIFSHVFSSLKAQNTSFAQELKTIYQQTKAQNENSSHDFDPAKSVVEDLTYVPNPSYFELHHSKLDLVVSGDDKNIMMVEAGSSEVTEEQMAKAFDVAMESLQELTKLQLQFVELINQTTPITALDLKPNVAPNYINEFWYSNHDKIDAAVFVTGSKGDRENALKAFQEEQLGKIDLLKKYLDLKIKAEKIEEIQNTVSELESTPLSYFTKLDLSAEELVLLNSNIKAWLNQSLDSTITQVIRRSAIKHKKRVDGRALDETRLITCNVGLLARTHGSSLFTRGETQVLNVLTLGSSSDAQTIDEMEDFEEQTKRYIHHYNFPSFSVGETGRYGAPGRREIGHGALAERALLPVLPDEMEFSYTMRLVSECLGSNGSTSMASTCASTLSLLDAGVPIKKMVAGVAMGLMLDSSTGEYEVLTDIQGLEDHHGDMDFKVTGTPDGITALQLDNKVAGLTPTVLKEALIRAKAGRLHILGIMASCIDKPRAELSKFAPRVMSILIPMDKIVDVIGPSGKIIKGIIARTGVDIDIEDKTGLCNIFGKDASLVQEAYNIVHEIIREYKSGEIVEGEVFRVEGFGAFVKLDNGKEGLVHISELAPWRVGRTEEILNLGQRVQCEVLGLNEKGQLMFSYKRFAKRPEEQNS